MAPKPAPVPHGSPLQPHRGAPDLPVAPELGAGIFEGHHVRLFERMRGVAGGSWLDDGAVRDYATTHARLSLALRSFFHPAAGRDLPWDLARTAELRPLLGSIDDPRRRALVERVVDRFDTRVALRWPRLTTERMRPPSSSASPSRP